ncbi:MAG TPA: CHAD domain-containing protein [Alphaproteobacteria bacterium]|jgi:inorganic triphosphatase YgiF|nr:CHAD domain-containing protein [Alphaproteobacteria bacterium]
MTDKQDPTEIELKLKIPRESLSRLLRHRALSRFGTGRPVKTRLISTYFDTPDLRLMRERIALRVRKVGGRHIQTLKCAPRAESGVNTRQEWETEIRHDRPDLGAFADSALKKRLAPHKIAPRLQAMFVTDIKRETWPLKVKGAEIDLAVDIGEIKSADARVPVCEAEFELKSGGIDGVYALARELHKSVPFIIEPLTKAERGYALAADIAPQPRKAEPLSFGKRVTAGECFQQIGRNGLLHLRANEACVCVSAAAEGIHQLRVAIRRLRSALSVFKQAIAAEARRRVANELKWIAKECARAREWDVFQDELLTPLRQRLPDEPTLSSFADAVARARSEADAAVADMLASPRYTKAILGAEAWWEGKAWRTDANGEIDQPAAKFAAKRLKKLHKRLCEYGDRLGDLKIAELHELRIRAKKLRYAVEFFRGLFGGPKVSRDYLAALAGIQDRLGALNDSLVVRDLLAEVKRRTPELDRDVFARAGALITGWNSAKVETDLKALPKAWDAFAKIRPFWK